MSIIISTSVLMIRTGPRCFVPPDIVCALWFATPKIITIVISTLFVSGQPFQFRCGGRREVTGTAALGALGLNRDGAPHGTGTVAARVVRGLDVPSLPVTRRAPLPRHALVGLLGGETF
jgi:hypothetical protein